jgi:hypothetical protein
MRKPFQRDDIQWKTGDKHGYDQRVHPDFEYEKNDKSAETRLVVWVDVWEELKLYFKAFKKYIYIKSLDKKFVWRIQYANAFFWLAKSLYLAGE